MLTSIRHRLVRSYLAWEHWWTRESYPHTIALVRIAMGAWLTLYWGLRMPHVRMIFSADGIVLPAPHRWTPEWLTWLWTPPSGEVALVIYAVLMVALVCLTIGLFSRQSAFVAFLLSVYYYHLSLHLFHTSFDRLYMMVLFVLAISACGNVFSMDAWEKHGSPLKWTEKVSVFGQRLIAFQITMTYLGVGWQKLWLPGWQGGEMLWYSLTGVWGTEWAFWVTSTFGYSEVYNVLVNFVIMGEFVLPIGLWIRAHGIRYYTMAAAAFFHIVIDLLLYIWWFAILLPAYITFFSPEEVYGALKKISRGRIQ